MNPRQVARAVFWAALSCAGCDRFVPLALGESDDVGPIEVADAGPVVAEAPCGQVVAEVVDDGATILGLGRFAAAADCAAETMKAFDALDGIGAAATSCTTIGTCVVCDYQGSTQPGDPASSAGVIAVSLGDTEAFRLEPSSTGSYARFAGAVPAAWVPGAPVRVTATGASVPAFDDKSLVVPAWITSAPAVAAGARWNVDRARDLTIFWGGAAAADSVIVEVFDDRFRSWYAGARCTFPAVAGGAVVPSVVLARMSTGLGAVSVFSAGVATTTVGDYAITLIARAAATNGHGVIPVLFE